MKSLRFIHIVVSILLLNACKKVGTKQCYECSTIRQVAGQIRTLEFCGTSREEEDFENKGYKYTVSTNSNPVSEIIPLACVEKD